MTSHLYDRLKERLAGVVNNAEVLIAVAAAFVSTAPNRAVAMKVADLGRKYGDQQAQVLNRASNGDEAWVVARDGRLVTVMYRRSQQPKRCSAFDTHLVVDLTGQKPVVLDRQDTINWRS